MPSSNLSVIFKACFVCSLRLLARLSSKLRIREMSETQGIQLYTEISFYHVLKLYSNNIMSKLVCEGAWLCLCDHKRIAGICIFIVDISKFLWRLLQNISSLNTSFLSLSAVVYIHTRNLWVKIWLHLQQTNPAVKGVRIRYTTPLS